MFHVKHFNNMSTTNENIVDTKQFMLSTNKGNFFFPAIYLNQPVSMDIYIENYAALRALTVSFFAYGTAMGQLNAFCPFTSDQYSATLDNGVITFSSRITASGDVRTETVNVADIWWPSYDGGCFDIGLVLLIGSDNMCYFYNGVGTYSAYHEEYLSNLTIDSYPTSDSFGIAHVNRNITLTGILSDSIPLSRFPVPIDYNWRTFDYLSGNRGQFSMTLAHLDSSIIGDGETAASSSDASKFSLSTQASIYNMLVNIVDNQETKVAYCGDNYMTITRRFVAGTAYDLIYFTLKFYFRSDTLIYTSPEFNIRADRSGDKYLCIIYDDTEEHAALDLVTTLDGSSIFYNNSSLPSSTVLSAMYIWLQDNGVDRSGPYDTGTNDNGGDPGNPRPQDHISDSSMPTTGALNLGLITLYRPTDSQLANIASFLWSDDVLDNFKKYFNNFSDNILSLYSLPYVPSGLSTRAFKVGTLVSETITNVEYCTVRYFDIDMGSINITQLWGSYLDYSPYTKIEIYLPYIGLHSLDIDEIMSPAKMDGTLPVTQGSTLSVVYRLDILTGIVVSKVKINGEIRYQFSGKCGFNIPLTGNTYSNLIMGFVNATAGAATMLATGGLTAPFSAAAAVTGTVQAQKPQVTRIGNISGDASALATDTPYIIITEPNKPLLDNQGMFTGFPSYKSGTLGSFSGFTQVIDAHVEGISCSEEERSRILSWLKEGVII